MKCLYWLVLCCAGDHTHIHTQWCCSLCPCELRTGHVRLIYPGPSPCLPFILFMAPGLLTVLEVAIPLGIYPHTSFSRWLFMCVVRPCMCVCVSVWVCYGVCMWVCVFWHSLNIHDNILRGDEATPFRASEKFTVGPVMCTTWSPWIMEEVFVLCSLCIIQGVPVRVASCPDTNPPPTHTPLPPSHLSTGTPTTSRSSHSSRGQPMQGLIWRAEAPLKINYYDTS